MYAASAILLCLFLLLASTVCLIEGIAIGKENGAETTSVVTPNPNNGFVVQSGYEGYLVSQAAGQKTSVDTWLAPASKLHLVKSILMPVSSFLLVYGVKAFGVVVHLLLALFLGVVATTAVCSFTPLCSISLAGPAFSFFRGQSVKEQVAELARTYMTPENVEMATRIVQGAIEQYSTVNQRRNVEQPESNDEQNVTT